MEQGPERNAPKKRMAGHAKENRPRYGPSPIFAVIVSRSRVPATRRCMARKTNAAASNIVMRVLPPSLAAKLTISAAEFQWFQTTPALAPLANRWLSAAASAKQAEGSMATTGSNQPVSLETAEPFAESSA